MKPAARVALLAVAGAVAGAGAKVADELGPRALADLGTYPAFWVLVIALIARWSTGSSAAAVRATSFFVPMVVAYYGTALYGFRFPIDGRYALAWGVGAVTVCPLLAAALHRAYASRRARAGVLPGLLAASVLVDGVVQRLLLAAEEPALLPAARPVQALADVVVMVVVAVVLPRAVRPRLVALPVLVVGVLVLPALLGRVLYASGLVG